MLNIRYFLSSLVFIPITLFAGNDMSQQQTTSSWLTNVQNTLTTTTGAFAAQDKHGTPIIIEWEKIDPQSPQLSEKIKSLSEILVQTYTQQELQFAQQHPEAVPHEFFLKSLAPFFEHGLEKVNWNLVKEKTQEIFKQFFTTTDFAQFSKAHEVHLFVVAKDKKTEIILGFIQFLITPEYAHGDVKAALSGVISTAQDRGLELLLMSTIFKLIPVTKRIFLHTRTTNDNIINLYKSWEFTQFPGQLAHWIDLEYKTEHSDLLKKTAESLKD